MKLPRSRTPAAMALALAAVSVPCVAWFVTGAREADREAAAIEQEAGRRAHEASIQLAGRLGDRLEALRAAESERPYYHYQRVYHDPEGASEGISLIPSPLASAPADPLIRVHFQVDAVGRLTLPAEDDGTPVTKTMNVATTASGGRPTGAGADAAATTAAGVRPSGAGADAAATTAAGVRPSGVGADAVATTDGAVDAPSGRRYVGKREQAAKSTDSATTGEGGRRELEGAIPAIRVASVPLGEELTREAVALAREFSSEPAYKAEAMVPKTVANAEVPYKAEAIFPETVAKPEVPPQAGALVPKTVANAEVSPQAGAMVPETVANAEVPPQAGAPSNIEQQQAAPPQKEAPFDLEMLSKSTRVASRKRMSKVQTLPPEAYAQNALSTELFAELKSRPSERRAPAEPRGRLERLTRRLAPVTIRLGDFAWVDLPLAGEASLVALRVVATPAGRLVQGFVLSRQALADWLRSTREAVLPVTVEPGPATGDFETAVPLAGAAWKVVVRATDGIDGSSTRASAVRARFYRSFLMGVLVAGLAGLCIVGLVWQSERLARQRTRFAASAAHELRTPLAGLRIYSEMLAEGLGDLTRTRDYARRIADEAERLGRVVGNVLEFTRLERGVLTVRPVPGDLGRAVIAAASRQQAALEAAGAQLELEVESGLPQVSFDPEAVQHIVQNLLDNAEKYSRGADDRSIRVQVARDGKGVRVSVSDRGPGIPRSGRRRLFRAFERGGGQDAPAGLGLGLALVQALARTHHAHVSYADNPGGGALFSVTFPAAA